MEGRVKTKDLPEIKAQLIEMQGGVCPLCNLDLRRVASINVVVDHCHDTGYIRAALHRGCNGAEGKIRKLAVGYGKSPNYVMFIKRLMEFWIKNRKPQTKWIHPKFKDENETREARNKKSRAIYAKKKKELATRQASLQRRLS